MSDTPLWTCEFIPKTGGPALDSLTVGARFNLKCHGDIAVNWDQNEVPHLKFAKEDETYSLAILNVVQQTPNDVQLEVTAYKAGDFHPEYIRVLQGGGTAEKGFETSNPKWQVKSVLDPKQPPQPYGPIGPWSLGLPLWFALVVGIMMLAL